MNIESLISIPIAGGIIAYLYKKMNNKVCRAECERIHEALDKRLGDMHEDIKIVKGAILKR